MPPRKKQDQAKASERTLKDYFANKADQPKTRRTTRPATSVPSVPEVIEIFDDEEPPAKRLRLDVEIASGPANTMSKPNLQAHDSNENVAIVTEENELGKPVEALPASVDSKTEERQPLNVSSANTRNSGDIAVQDNDGRPSKKIKTGPRDDEEGVEAESRDGAAPVRKANLAKNSTAAYAAKRQKIRAEQIEAIAPRVLFVWKKRFIAIVDKFLAVREAISSSTSDLELLKNVESVVRSYDRIEQLPSDAEMWTELKAEAITTLANIARQPDRFDYASCPHLVESTKDSPVLSDTAEFYTRVVTLKDPIHCFRKYLVYCPMDAPYAIFHLILLRDNLFNMEQVFMKAMANHIHPTAISGFFTYIRESGCDSALRRAYKPRVQDYSLTYDGTSTSNNAEIRKEQSKKQSMKEQKGESRWANFTKVNGLQDSWRSFTHVRMNIVNVTPLQARSYKLPNHYEALLIDLRGGLGLNSARGGIIPEFIPTPENKAIVATSLSDPALSSSADTFGSTVDQQLIAKVEGLLVDECQYQSSTTSEPISATAMSYIIQNGARILRTINGSVVSVSVPKDITAEEYHGIIQGMFGKLAGRGFQILQKLHSLVDPAIPLLCDFDEDTLARSFGTYLDFWRFVLKHIEFIIHCLYLSRIFLAEHPLSVVAISNPISTAIMQCYLATAWRRIMDSSVSLAFRSGTTPLNFHDHIEPFHRKPPALQDEKFIEAVGTLRILPYGDGEGDFAVFIFQADTGRYKYDPLLASVRVDLDFLVFAKTRVLQRATSSLLSSSGTIDLTQPDTRRSFLERVIAIVDDICGHSGLEDALKAAKDVARQFEEVAGNLQGIDISKPVSTLPTVNEDEDPDESDLGVAERWMVSIGAPRSAARVEQVSAIVSEMQLLARYKVFTGAWYLVPWHMRGDVEKSRQWLLDCPEDKSYTHRARTEGKDKESQARQHHNQTRTVRQKAEQERRDPATGLDQKMVQERLDMANVAKLAVHDLSPAQLHPSAHKDSRYVPLCELHRCVCCHRCGQTLFECRTHATHRCSSQDEDNTVDIELKPENFPDLIYFQYLHDLLRYRPAVQLISGNDVSTDNGFSAAISSICADFNLVVASVKDIIEQYQSAIVDTLVPYSLLSFSRSQQEVIDLLTPPSRFESESIYISSSTTGSDATKLQVRLAVDVILRVACNDRPLSPELAQKERMRALTFQGNKIATWLSDIQRKSQKAKLYMLACKYNFREIIFDAKRNQHGREWALHSCDRAKTRMAEAKARLGDNFQSFSSHSELRYTLENGIRDCGTSNITFCRSLWDLPSEWARRSWYLATMNERSDAWEGKNASKGTQDREIRDKKAEAKKGKKKTD